jgi:hypothetical protein
MTFQNIFAELSHFCKFPIGSTLNGDFSITLTSTNGRRKTKTKAIPVTPEQYREIERILTQPY